MHWTCRFVSEDGNSGPWWKSRELGLLQARGDLVWWTRWRVLSKTPYIIQICHTELCDSIQLLQQQDLQLRILSSYEVLCFALQKVITMSLVHHPYFHARVSACSNSGWREVSGTSRQVATTTYIKILAGSGMTIWCVQVTSKTILQCNINELQPLPFWFSKQTV